MGRIKSFWLTQLQQRAAGAFFSQNFACFTLRGLIFHELWPIFDQNDQLLSSRIFKQRAAGAFFSGFLRFLLSEILLFMMFSEPWTGACFVAEPQLSIGTSQIS